MLKGIKKDFSKEEELELGRVIQRGLAAEKEIEETPNLSDESLKELEVTVLKGEVAHARLFETHIALANSLAVRMQRQTQTNYPLEDLQQDAYFALSEAAKTYDPSKNCVLTTHAYYKIAKALSVKINKMRPVRLPENRMGDYLHITKAEAEFIQMNSGNADSDKMIDYVVEKTGLTKEVIALIKQTIRGAVSLNAPLGEDGGEFGDLIQDENAPSYEIENPMLADIVSKLTPFEIDVLAFESEVGIPSMSLNDFLDKYNMSKEELQKKGKQIVRLLKKQHSTKGGK